MLVVIAAYVLTNYAYLAVLGHDGLAASQAPAADVMSRVFGTAGAKLIAIGIAISTLGFRNITLVAGARVLQVMGQDGLFFSSVARLHPRYRTPNIALMMLSAWAIVLVWIANYGQLLDFAAFGDWAALRGHHRHAVLVSPGRPGPARVRHAGLSPAAAGLPRHRDRRGRGVHLGQATQRRRRLPCGAVGTARLRRCGDGCSEIKSLAEPRHGCHNDPVQLRKADGTARSDVSRTRSAQAGRPSAGAQAGT